MAPTFMQMAQEAMEQAQSVSAKEAIAELNVDATALLVDVRDESEVEVTGMGTQAFNEPGRSIAWLADADPANDYRDAALQDRGRRILTTCGMSPAIAAPRRQTC